jgi:hypothetical protein
MTQEFGTAGQPAAEPKAPRNLSAEFGKLPGAERVLAIAAVAVLLGFMFHEAREDIGTWFRNLALFGSLAVLILVTLKLFGVQLLRPAIDTRILVICAALPVVGFVVDKLKPFWGFVLFAGAILMAYTAAKISTREKLIRKRS